MADRREDRLINAAWRTDERTDSGHKSGQTKSAHPSVNHAFAHVNTVKQYKVNYLVSSIEKFKKA